MSKFEGEKNRYDCKPNDWARWVNVTGSPRNHPLPSFAQAIAILIVIPAFFSTISA